MNKVRLTFTIISVSVLNSNLDEFRGHLSHFHRSLGSVQMNTRLRELAVPTEP